MGMDATTKPLFPSAGSAPPREIKRRKFALSWAADEAEFARWLIAEWNQVFKGLPGGKSASMVRGNTGAAVRFYRRLCHAESQGTQSSEISNVKSGSALSASPRESPLSRDAITAAIRAYADNPANKALKPPAWRYFRDWIDEAEDRIAAELSRIGWKQTDSAAQQARDLLDHLELGRLAREANAEKTALSEHVVNRIVHWEGRVSKQRREAVAMMNWLNRVNDLYQKFLLLPSDQRRPLVRKAMGLFDAMACRRCNGTTDDSNIVGAIALALLDRQVASGDLDRSPGLAAGDDKESANG